MLSFEEQYLNLNFNLLAMSTRTPNSTEHACFGFWSVLSECPN